MKNKIQKNIVSLFGEIISEWEYDHETMNERFGRVSFRIERQSGTSDVLPLMVSEKFLEVGEIKVGTYATVNGAFRSYNIQDEAGKSHLVLVVFVDDLFLFTADHDMWWKNEALLDGYICKPTIYRKTPLGREVTDFILAVNRAYGKTDYIPCICWGRNAKFAAHFKVGDMVTVSGRLQSREYQKTMEDGTVINRTAYELSARSVDRISIAV